MPNHTPGPWNIECEPWLDELELHIWSANGQDNEDGVHLASVSPDYVGVEQRNANAYLIAAAPDLLAMLIRVRETCHLSEDEELGDDIDRLIGNAMGQPHYKELNDLLDDLDAQEDEDDRENI